MSLLRKILCAAALVGGATSASAYNSIVAFGDSLSDNGKLLSLTGGAIPLPAYWQGRFSNGKAAVEVMAQQLGVGLVDFAVGGAGTGLTNPQLLGTPLENTGIQSQLGWYLSATSGHADPGSLYFVWGGPNDFLTAVGSSPATFASIISTGVTNLVGTVDQLYTAGARNFLLPLMPDLGATPRALGLNAIDPTASLKLAGLSDSFNSHLADAYSAWAVGHSDAHVTVFDTFTRQHLLLAAAGSLGLTDTTTPCFTGAPDAPGTLCSNPLQHFYWDDIHPSAAVHNALGQQFAAAVPEPSTYVLMALGLVGIAARRARLRTAA